MNSVRTLGAVGIALLCFGVGLLALSFADGASVLRITGPVLGFLGLVLLAQAKRRRRSI